MPILKKLYSLLLLLVIAYTCGYSQSSGSKKLNQLFWLIGTWERQNVKPGKTSHEHWESVSDNTMQGWGVTLAGTDTIFVEKLQIVNNAAGLFYVADVAENAEPVYFKIVALSEQGFVSENPEHDFPKRIAYALNGDQLKVTISGDGKEIDFLFRKETQ